MKYYSVLTVVVLLFFINISWGQIEKNNNVIIITGGYSTAENFDVTAKYLINNGFTFETINKEYNQMVTNSKSYAGAFNYKLIVNFENKIVFIRASLQLMNLGQQLMWVDWEYAKSRGSYYNKAYLKFNPIVEGIVNKIDAVEVEFKTE